MKINKKIITYIFIIFFSSYPVFAASPRGMAFLRMNSFARSEAMAGAFTAVAEGPDGLYYNPAGVSGAEEETVSLHASYLIWTADTSKQSVVAIIPYHVAEKYFYINSLSVDYFAVPGLTKYDEDGTALGDMIYNDLAVSLNFGSKNKDMAYGANLKILNENIDVYSGAGAALDLGILYDISTTWRAGISLSNIGFFKLDSIQVGLPFSFRSGISVRNTERTYLIAVDYEQYNSDSIFHVGGELTRNGYFLRGGWRNTQETGEYTLGIGADSSENYMLNWNVQVFMNYSYTFAPYFQDANIQRLDIGVKF